MLAWLDKAYAGGRSLPRPITFDSSYSETFLNIWPEITLNKLDIFWSICIKTIVCRTEKTLRSYLILIQENTFYYLWKMYCLWTIGYALSKDRPPAWEFNNMLKKEEIFQKIKKRSDWVWEASKNYDLRQYICRTSVLEKWFEIVFGAAGLRLNFRTILWSIVIGAGFLSTVIVLHILLPRILSNEGRLELRKVPFEQKERLTLYFVYIFLKSNLGGLFGSSSRNYFVFFQQKQICLDRVGFSRVSLDVTTLKATLKAWTQWNDRIQKNIKLSVDTF